MESGLPILSCLLQLALKNLCSSSFSSSSSSSASSSSKWVYSIFWRILPRNFPPPKWEFGGSALDRSKGNKRNWILVWEDGFCDFYECEQSGSGYIKGRFGADLFFKMSHEVYNYGEGLVGKVAADNSHKWVFRDTPNETDATFISPWNASIEPTIAVIAVREGIIQLGSFDKIPEDLNFVISIQRKFSYLQSIPGIFAIQRPYLPSKPPYMFKLNSQTLESHESRQPTGMKRLFDDTPPNDSPMKSINLGWNTPQNATAGSPIWAIPPLLPPISSQRMEVLYCNKDMKMESGIGDQQVEEKLPICRTMSPSMGIDLGFGLSREGEASQVALNLN